jgi:hypothetical protein
MQPQEIFDKVVTHLRDQGVSSSNDLYCCYRLQRQSRMLKCAVGCLIPDEMYSPDMEEKAYNLLVEAFPAVRELIGKENDGLICELQRIHDRVVPFEWEEEFKELANKYNLKYEEPVCNAISGPIEVST